MHTEEEAKKKWCPMMRSNNQFPYHASCLASECMMWKWASDTPKIRKAMEMNPDECDGYCGLTK